MEVAQGPFFESHEKQSGEEESPRRKVDERRRLIKLSVRGGGGEVPGGRTGGEYQTPSLFGEKDRTGAEGKMGADWFASSPQGSRSQPPRTREEEGGDKLIFFRHGGVHLVVIFAGFDVR